MLATLFVMLTLPFVTNFAINPLSANPTKLAKHTETFRRQSADELFKYVWPFC